jgi:uncharacterized caspase-like protein
VALLFYAGHGLPAHGRNYLVPVDAALEFEADVGPELFELKHISIRWSVSTARA